MRVFHVVENRPLFCFLNLRVKAMALEELPDRHTYHACCCERGEFHTFCFRCPEFTADIPVTLGDVIEREGFWFADLRAAGTTGDDGTA